MGLLDLFNRLSTPQVPSALPALAKQEINAGRLPVLRTTQIFVRNGENCHYVENAIYEKEKKKRHTVRRNKGYSVPGLFKGTRIHVGNGGSDSYEESYYEKIQGKLFITNKRVIFVGSEDSFDEDLNNLTAITPYANCMEFHFNNRRYRIFLPDGNIANRTIQLLK